MEEKERKERRHYFARKETPTLVLAAQDVSPVYRSIVLELAAADMKPSSPWDNDAASRA